MYKNGISKNYKFSINPDNKDLPKFVTKKWIEVYDQSQGNYDVNKEIRIKTSMLRSYLCDYSDAYIVVKGTITVLRPNAAKKNKAVAFKNNGPFINCISKINGVKINPLSSHSESFKYKNNITGNTYNVNAGEEGYDANKVGKNEAEVVFPLKYLSNFWRSLNIPLINSEVELILTWSKNCVLADMTVRAPQGGDLAIVAPTKLEFKITDTKLYVPVVTLSKENDIKLLDQLKSGFKRIIKWNKYRSQMTIQPQNNNLNYLIDPTFTKVNRLFVLSFPRNNNTDSRYCYSHYYVPKLKLKILMS